MCVLAHRLPREHVYLGHAGTRGGEVVVSLINNCGGGGAGMPATTMPPASVVGRGDAMGAGQQFPMPGYGGMMAQPPMQTMDPAMMAQFHSAGMAPGMPGPGAPGP